MTEVLDHDRQRILARRARALARPGHVATHYARENYLICRVERSLYALHVRFIFEIARRVEVIPIPGAPSPFAGIVPLRSELFPVIDVAAWLGSETVRSARSFFVACGGARPELAIAVDEVLEVQRIDAGAIIASGAPGKFGHTEDGVTVLDGDRLLSDPGLHLTRSDQGF